MKNKRRSVFLGILGMMLFFVLLCSDMKNVYAVSITKGGSYSWSTYGISKCDAKWSYTRNKTIHGHAAYCIEEKQSAGSSATACNSSNCPYTTGSGSADKVFAGVAIDFIEDKFSDYGKRYTFITALLNTYFARNPDASSRAKKEGRKPANMYCDDQIAKYYDKIMERKNKIVNLKVDKPKINVDGNTIMSKVSGKNYYVSRKVTVKNLGNNVDGVETKIDSISSSNKSITFCTSANGTGCASTTTKTSFYVKCDGSDCNNNSNITIKVDVSANVKFRAVAFYHAGKDEQDVAERLNEKTNKKASNNNTMSFRITSTPPPPDIPNTYTVNLYKVNENGGALSGAEFDVTFNGQKVELTDSDGLFSFTTNESPSGKEVTITETKSPDGYTLLKEPINTTIPTRSGCYKSSGSDADDTLVVGDDENYCKTITPMCKEVGKEELVPVDGATNLCEVTASKVCYNSEEQKEDETKCTSVEDPSSNPEGEEGYKVMCKDLNEAKDAFEYSDYATGDCESKSVPKGKVVSTVDDKKIVDDKYADAEQRENYYHFDVSGNTFLFNVENLLNSVSVSKKAITGDEEVVGAKLKICTKDDFDGSKDKCEPTKNINEVDLEWVSGDTPANIRGLKTGTYYLVEVTPPFGYQTTTSVEFTVMDDGTVKVGDKSADSIVLNDKLSSVSISKVDVASGKELPGAKLAVCYSNVPSEYPVVSKDSSTYTEEEDEKDTSGLEPSDSGSSEETADEGAADEDEPVQKEDDGSEGEATGDEEDDGTIKMALSDEGDCIPVVLYDGSEAFWTSSDKPKQLVGLPAGTYYLVETQSPEGYTTSESMLFTLNNDGSIVDKDGKVIKDNKLVMTDKKIEDVNTGYLPFIVAALIGVGAVGLGAYYFTHSHANAVSGGNNSNVKVRKRKIHK